MNEFHSSQGCKAPTGRPRELVHSASAVRGISVRLHMESDAVFLCRREDYATSGVLELAQYRKRVATKAPTAKSPHPCSAFHQPEFPRLTPIRQLHLYCSRRPASPPPLSHHPGTPATPPAIATGRAWKVSTAQELCKDDRLSLFLPTIVPLLILETSF